MHVDACREHVLQCDHLTKLSSCGDMRRSPHASPPPRAREFAGGVISHHLTNFGVVPAKAICRTRTIFCESILFISFWECPRGSTHRCRRSCPCRPNWHSATICTVSCSCSGPFMMRWFVYLFVAVRRVALSVFCSLDILL